MALYSVDIGVQLFFPCRFNPFNREPEPLPDKLSELHPTPPRSVDVLSPKSKSEASSFEDTDADSLEPLEPFLSCRVSWSWSGYVYRNRTE